MTTQMQHMPQEFEGIEPYQEDRVEVSAVALMNKSEVEAQISAAHRFPRSIQRFLTEATTLATFSREIAESCIYAVPRDGKTISGPSVRLAEICASAYGNMHVGARILDADEKEITSQGVAWDLQKNLRVTVESKRRITGRSGRRYSDDMVTTTGNAAASIALRNAIFRVIPKAYVQAVYDKARAVAVGDAKTLASRREEVVQRLTKIGVHPDRVFAKLGKKMPDIDLEDVETLIGLGTAIKGGDMTIDEAFPPVVAAPAPTAPAEEGRRVSLRGAKKDAPAGPAPDPASGAVRPEDEPPPAAEG